MPGLLCFWRLFLKEDLLMNIAIGRCSPGAKQLLMTLGRICPEEGDWQLWIGERGGALELHNRKGLQMRLLNWDTDTLLLHVQSMTQKQNNRQRAENLLLNLGLKPHQLGFSYLLEDLCGSGHLRAARGSSGQQRQRAIRRILENLNPIEGMSDAPEAWMQFLRGILLIPQSGPYSPDPVLSSQESVFQYDFAGNLHER